MQTHTYNFRNIKFEGSPKIYNEIIKNLHTHGFSSNFACLMPWTEQL